MKIFKFTRPSLNLGPPPRSRYPLVIILIDDWLVDALTDIQSTNDIGSLISFVHLKDELCPSSTHIFDQYVKTHCGTLHNIKPVYVASSDVHSEHETSSSLPSSSSSPLPSSSSQPVASSSTPTALAKNNSAENRSKNTDQSFCCCVCLTNKIGRVLLPCRHACVCAPCCDRLLYCPICRNVISRTFDLDC
ncbi:hypothetical protein HELRODRAFT_91669 [Helobdella robusta]|uniref:RING-type domain-containing protein n=1 Tax=Helobdella robusta TaxID=6412 RepID=T1G875_HELRO|nr:hypothetical protein HELRODRAFT_91669 [Helobdella robusta]ESO11162.1 hypothetical protein HELRODRAFT_91669 [Helobdella robusta]